jgi:hypothetical protein
LFWFGLKTDGDGFFRFGLKIGGDGFSRFGLKTAGFGISYLGLKTGCCGLAILTSKSLRRFFGLGLKTKRLRFVACATKPKEVGRRGTHVEI